MRDEESAQLIFTYPHGYKCTIFDFTITRKSLCLREFIHQTQQIIQSHSNNSMGIAESITQYKENKRRRRIEDEENKKIERQLRKWIREENNNAKMLLLGNDMTGKNILMKQVSIYLLF